MTVLITGANGSIGRALAKRLENPWLTDIDTLDVRDAAAANATVWQAQPALVYHLAGAKHAPEGETDPWATADVNVNGTRNVLAAAATVGAHVITASTCKACDPETVYGATKLIAERMTLEAGGSVARFYNVRETQGNVFETWRAIPECDPLPVAPCWRYFIGIQDAVRLLLSVATLEPGRYTIDPGEATPMASIARETYPERAIRAINPRRGDRRVEPRAASSEWVERVGDGIERVRSSHEQA